MIDVKDLMVLATIIATDGTVAVQRFSADKGRISYAPKIPKMILKGDTLTAKYLAAMTNTIAGIKVEETTPFKFPIVDTLFTQFGEFIKVIKWTVAPGQGHENESLYDQFDSDYYKKHWIKNPSSDKQVDFIEDFAAQYLTDGYILEGLTPESDRNKENIIKALTQQVPRIFRVSNLETITRLKALVKAFLKYYIEEEENGQIRCKNVSVVSSLQTNVNPVHLVDKEVNYDEVLQQAAQATTATVKFGTHKGYSIPGTMKIGSNEFGVTIKPVLGCYSNYEGSEIKVNIAKKFGHEFLAIPVQFATQFEGKKVILPRTEMVEFIKKHDGESEMNLYNQYSFLAAQFIEQIMEDLNKETRVKIERARLMEETFTSTKGLLEYC